MPHRPGHYDDELLDPTGGPVGGQGGGGYSDFDKVVSTGPSGYGPGYTGTTGYTGYTHEGGPVGGQGGGGYSGSPSFGGLVGELGIELPEGYEDWTYEYDPARESFLRREAERKKGGYKASLFSNLRDISRQGRASLMQMRQPGRGGFAGTGGNLLGMSVEDLYSGISGKRGTAVGQYGRDIAGAEDVAAEGIRTGRLDWRQEALGHLMDLQQMYGSPFEQAGGVQAEDWGQASDFGRGAHGREPERADAILPPVWEDEEEDERMKTYG